MCEPKSGGGEHPPLPPLILRLCVQVRPALIWNINIQTYSIFCHQVLDCYLHGSTYIITTTSTILLLPLIPVTIETRKPLVLHLRTLSFLTSPHNYKAATQIILDEEFVRNVETDNTRPVCGMSAFFP